MEASEAKELVEAANKKEFELAISNIKMYSKLGKMHYEGYGHLSNYTILELEKLGYKVKNFVDSNLNFCFGGYLPENPYSYDMHNISWK